MLLAGWTVAAVAAVAVLPGPLRAVLVVPFLVFGPGLGLVPLLGLRARMHLGLTIGISAAVEIVVAEAMLYGHVWSPGLGMVVLGALTLAGAALQFRAERRPEPASVGTVRT